MKNSFLIIPRESYEHPVFETLEKHEAMETLLTFKDTVSQQELNNIYHKWTEDVDWEASGGQPDFVVEFNGKSLFLGFAGVPHPKEAVKKLIDKMSASFILSEVLLNVREIDDEGTAGCSRVDPRMPAQQECESEEEFWNSGFDATLLSPVSEDSSGMFSIATLESGATITEYRGMPLFVPGFRIAYGLTNIGERPLDSRNQEVLAQVIQSLDQSFNGKRPTLYNQEGQPDNFLDPVTKEGRDGYAFALQRGEEMTATYPGKFRYREHELMYGLCDAIQKLGLESVVHWVRGNVYIVNLWEKQLT